MISGVGPMAVTFVALFGVGIAQITVGFHALDRLGLEPAAAARVAGIALTLVGVARVLSQALVQRLAPALAPPCVIRIGGAVAACGFAAAAWIDTVSGLWACCVVSAAGMGWIFPAVATLAANAVGAHDQGSTAGSIGTAQGMVTRPLIGTLLYAAGPAVPWLLVAAMLQVMMLWPVESTWRSPD